MSSHRAALQLRCTKHGCLAAIPIIIVGCGASAMPPASTAASAKHALIAAPCAGTPANPEASGSGYARVFIQAAQVVSSDLHHPLGSWLAEHPVTTPSVASFIGAGDVPTTVPWTHCLDAACDSSEPWKLTVTPALPVRASEPVLLTLQLQRDQETAGRTQSKTLETRNQQPVVVNLDGPAEESVLSLVVTPYLIGDDEDLHRLAECRSRSAALTSHRLSQASSSRAPSDRNRSRSSAPNDSGDSPTHAARPGT
jgi:hypothetical protein